MKEPHSTRWVPVAETVDTEYTVTGLKDGANYEFRVAAENKAGVGKYSEATEPITAKEPYGKNSFKSLYYCTNHQCHFFYVFFSVCLQNLGHVL